MTISTNQPLHWNGERFFAADRIGFTEDGHFVLSLYNYPPPYESSGNYFTTIPISEKSFRDRTPTKAAFKVHLDAKTVFCDWSPPAHHPRQRTDYRRAL